MAADDPGNPWSNSGWNVTEQMRYHAKHGAARASARARDAGTKLGGSRPGSGGRQSSGGSGSGEQRTAIIKHISSGWSPVLAVVVDGARRVERLVGWTSGQGSPPAGAGKYIGPTGLVDTAAEATDIRGPAGPPGSGGGGGSGSSLMLEVLTAGETLSGHTAVYLSGADTVRKADSTNPSQVGRVIGVTTGAAVLGDPIEVQIAGLLTEPSFAFTPGPVYFTSTGVLTQTVPTTGFIQQVATAISATEIVVQLGMSIVLQ